MVLVTYASKHGATEGIARAIAERLTARGEQVEVHPADRVGDLDGVDAVVLGSAVYGGSWMRDATTFARRFAGDLIRVPVWLFSSGPLGSQVHDDEEQPKQLPELRTLLDPRDHQVFFGALDPDVLSFSERMIVKAVNAPTGDFRDWDAIGAWADRIADALEAA